MLMHRIATDLSMSLAEVGRLSSLEITKWVAHYQIEGWMEKGRPKSGEYTADMALAFARGVNEILERRFYEEQESKIDD